MPIYVVLGKFTQQGIQKIKEAPARIEAVKQAMHKLGVEIKEHFSVMGRYDFITLLEAADDEAMARAALVIGSWGNVRTETMRAFSEEEFRKIVAILP